MIGNTWLPFAGVPGLCQNGGGHELGTRGAVQIYYAHMHLFNVELLLEKGLIDMSHIYMVLLFQPNPIIILNILAVYLIQL